MTSMKKISAFIVLVVSITVHSCTNKLDLNPISQVTVNSYWKTPDDVKGYVNGMYARFRMRTNATLFYLGEARSEVIGEGSIQNPAEKRLYFENTLDKITAPDWIGLYTVIHDANLLLKYVPGITYTVEGDKSNVLAQAYAMRAYVYYILVRTWGGVPLVKEPTESYDANTIYRPRNTAAEVFTQIKSDIDKALELFSDNTFRNKRHEWSKPAVSALKGDVYLWTAKRNGGGDQDLQTALTALQEAQKADVALLGNFNDVFDYTNKGNKEILFAVSYADLEAESNYNQDLYIRPVDIPQGLDDATKQKLGAGGGNNWITPSETLRKQFSADDLRKDRTFLELYTKDAGGNAKYYTAVVLKYKGFVDAGGRKFLDDVIIYRYADVLLMIAEVKNALKMDPSNEMNLVRQRAYGAKFEDYKFVAASQLENDNAILKERLLELSFEAKRWWDLVRFNKAFDLVPSLQNRKGKDYLLLFPVSESTISLNAKITQNPGY